jgi:hypothetical protein
MMPIPSTARPILSAGRQDQTRANGPAKNRQVALSSASTSIVQAQLGSNAIPTTPLVQLAPTSQTGTTALRRQNALLGHPQGGVFTQIIAITSAETLMNQQRQFRAIQAGAGLKQHWLPAMITTIAKTKARSCNGVLLAQTQAGSVPAVLPTLGNACS